MGYEIGSDGRRYWTPKGDDEAGHHWQWEDGASQSGGGDYVCSNCGKVGKSFAGKCDRSKLKKLGWPWCHHKERDECNCRS